MERVAFRLRVKEGRLDEYKCIHQAVWPELLAASDANRRWQDAMREYLATPVEVDAPEPLQRMEQVFRMD